MKHFSIAKIQLLYNIERNYDFDRAHPAAPHAKAPLQHLLSISTIWSDATKTEISHKFYLRFFLQVVTSLSREL